MKDLTVIYYTANKENPEFEGRIRNTLLEAIGDLPLISVSQKPIDFGKNICVGDIGASPQNVLLQIKAGATEATTRFVTMGEADILYPKCYFEFVPERDDTFYYADQVYLIWVGHNTFWYKRRAELSSIVNREHLINTINKLLGIDEYHISKNVPKLTRQSTFHIDIPIVDIKTKNGLHWRSPHSKGNFKQELPYWGTGKDIWEKYL